MEQQAQCLLVMYRPQSYFTEGCRLNAYWSRIDLAVQNECAACGQGPHDVLGGRKRAAENKCSSSTTKIVMEQQAQCLLNIQLQPNRYNNSLLGVALFPRQLDHCSRTIQFSIGQTSSTKQQLYQGEPTCYNNALLGVALFPRQLDLRSRTTRFSIGQRLSSQEEHPVTAKLLQQQRLTRCSPVPTTIGSSLQNGSQSAKDCQLSNSCIKRKFFSLRKEHPVTAKLLQQRLTTCSPVFQNDPILNRPRTKQQLYQAEVFSAREEHLITANLLQQQQRLTVKKI
ncbi:hypothetical protein FF38_08238 [Lucilia cuprina]|uniref:Uncharacterized protein n=1 Tax=Lucilia cuprina TaxID=7375 RepID=A0A0L0BYW3_LUCCU|nr:hypothetical protein FF38_08238 [Lucilia cuprina]